MSYNIGIIQNSILVGIKYWNQSTWIMVWVSLYVLTVRRTVFNIIWYIYVCMCSFEFAKYKRHSAYLPSRRDKLADVYVRVLNYNITYVLYTNTNIRAFVKRMQNYKRIIWFVSRLGRTPYQLHTYAFGVDDTRRERSWGCWPGSRCSISAYTPNAIHIYILYL